MNTGPRAAAEPTSSCCARRPRPGSPLPPPPELKDLPPDFWDDAVVKPAPKRAISLRVDQDVLDWFRAGGPRYQTRMNAVLRSYMSRMLGK